MDLFVARCIMLDIDGVLNSHRTAVGFRHVLQKKLDPVAVAILYRIVGDANAKIVVSSTWRSQDDWKEHIWGCLREAGWPWEHTGFLPLGECPIIDRTPLYIGPNAVRGDEIEKWLNDNPAYDDYIILDDDSDMLEHQMDRFIKCDHHVGLGWDQWIKIKQIWPELN